MVPIDPGTFENRLARTRAALREGSLDALLLTHLPNIAYLTGFAGSGAQVLVGPDTVHFVTDPRYAASAGDLVAGLPATQLVVVDRTYDEAAAELLAARPAWRVGVEARHLSLSRWRWLMVALGGTPDPGVGDGAAVPSRPALVPADGLVERLRRIKDEGELALFRSGAALMAQVALELAAFVRPGRTEREAAADLDRALLRVGFERPAFETVVAAGERSAHPHARPTDRQLSRGEPVLLDFGGVYGGYCLDVSRTRRIGQATAEAHRAHEAVAAAAAAAIRAVRPGVPASEVDRAARATLDGLGFGPAFVHSVGHGLGLELHEEPRVGRLLGAGRFGEGPEDVVLQPGMVITIEPGVYLANRFGIRIEDDVVVTSSGSEILTDSIERGFVDLLA